MRLHIPGIFRNFLSAYSLYEFMCSHVLILYNEPSSQQSTPVNLQNKKYILSIYAQLWIYFNIWTVYDGHQICALSFLCHPPLQNSARRTSSALTSPTSRCNVGIVTSQTSKESMYRHTTAVTASLRFTTHFTASITGRRERHSHCGAQGAALLLPVTATSWDAARHEMSLEQM